MKTLAIYFSDPDMLDYPLNKQIYLEAYTELIEYWQKKRVQAVVVRGDSYLGQGKFKPYFKWDSTQKSFKKVTEVIQSDLIWNRDSKNRIPHITDHPILNHPDFDEICRDKLKTVEMLPKLSAQTFLIDSFEDLKLFLPQIKSQKVVLKPRDGEGSYGVHALEKSEINKDLYPQWKNILLQEFLDSSAGIESLVEGLHEINIITVNGRFAGARIKQPAQGTFIASAFGSNRGKTWGIHFKQIPTELWREVKKIDKKFSHYSPRLFRADFVHTQQDGYKLIELNSRPGVMHTQKEGADFYWDFNGTLAEIVVEILS